MKQNKKTKPTAQKIKPRRLSSKGWLTSDEDEIERRRQRATTESFRISSATQQDSLFADYQVQSTSGSNYAVEIRSLHEPLNSCNCTDQRINRLGVCKHIEATLLWLSKKGIRRFRQAAQQGSPYAEIYLDRRDQHIHIAWPQGWRSSSKPGRLLADFFNDDLLLAGDALDKLPALLRTIDSASSVVKKQVRVSCAIIPWLESLEHKESQLNARHHFETELAAGRADIDICKTALYPYQREGMLHLAFSGRSLLADEMGLGKTVQAIAACELLRRLHGIRRVLVIAPASLKGEWEEQIGKFTDLSTHIVQGSRAQRLQQYQRQEFFFLANYEQIPPDVEQINTLLMPDVVILDEAQRIKNWQTKTAIAIKRLSSTYAFVLTGTPLENRIDEIYSIVQFLDPNLFGPLFRFNREYYQLDDNGRATGYKNLDLLHKKLAPIMLRRRKHEVEGELPARTVNTYMVPMHKEQRLRYDEYEMRMARLAHTAKSRPLSKQEMERLQGYLACMRMLCDTPYILDKECRISPKLVELENLLQEIIEDGGHKVIIFSEWQRMLELVRESAEKKGIDYSWHTGQVSQKQRREEIKRFRQDADCLLFLSTDSGSVGLNLQIADIVINLDLPWNPAKLEQRIARAWRKHQKRPVQVINLVAEHSIEQRMLSLLDQKRSLAEGVMDGEGPAEMGLPSGRAAFLDRLQELTKTTESKPEHTTEDPSSRLLQELLAQWPGRLQRVTLSGTAAKRTLLIVMDQLNDALKQRINTQVTQIYADNTPQVKLLDAKTWSALEEMIAAGLLDLAQAQTQTLYVHDSSDSDLSNAVIQRHEQAIAKLQPGLHKQRMARVLADGGFGAEALAPMKEAMEQAIFALLHWHDIDPVLPLDQEIIRTQLIDSALLPAQTLLTFEGFQHIQTDTPENINQLLIGGHELIKQISAIVCKA